MKNQVFISVLFFALFIVIGFGVNKKMSNDISVSELMLKNIEALAQDENPSEKIYRYVVTNNDCLVYVGGAYAKGKEVTCWPGDEHPVCVVCKL